MSEPVTIYRHRRFGSALQYRTCESCGRALSVGDEYFAVHSYTAVPLRGRRSHLRLACSQACAELIGVRQAVLGGP